ncbi:ATP-binding protein [Ignisphaera sp. 4213-co]|uniref:ATP-binding protein n=1 Tax=Ignisphaera cupida TaxID=3050454 RepID=A0ABD4Z9N4_9CREN|nr:ATP-binding protein [Ignisphaera sp. 4213-co]MDK6028808.1 ATP-binding protein [Ignisphaera sp. 4213-co]
MKRIKLLFASSFEVLFVDRDLAIRRVEEWAEKSTYPVQVVFGPEGCGKTAWLRQSAVFLKELGFDVLYFNPVEKEFLFEIGFSDLRKEFLSIVEEAAKINAFAGVAWRLIDFAKKAIAHGSKKLAILVDDAFQVIGLDKAAIYVKGLLGVLEYPPKAYEKIVVVATTSEGLSRFEIGRHRWANLLPMWNLSKNGFEELYNQLPSPKPDFEEVWRATGGNPSVLENLYKNNLSIDRVVKEIVSRKRLRDFIARLGAEERKWLVEAIEDPDTLYTRSRMSLKDELVKLNLIIDDIPPREEFLWIDTPPPEKDLELGIGKYVAWQTPLHREAVKKALEIFN